MQLELHNSRIDRLDYTASLHHTVYIDRSRPYNVIILSQLSRFQDHLPLFFVTITRTETTSVSSCIIDTRAQLLCPWW